MTDDEQRKEAIAAMFRGYGQDPKPERLAFYLRILGPVGLPALRRAIDAVCAAHEAQTPPAVGKLAAALARLGVESRTESEAIAREQVTRKLLDDYADAVRGQEGGIGEPWFTNFPHRIAWLDGQAIRGGLRGDLARAIADRLRAEWSAKRAAERPAAACSTTIVV